MTAIHDPNDTEPGTAMTQRNGAPIIEARADSVTDLLRMAVQRGTPVAELRELVALHDQMAQRQARQEFAKAMAAFQQECPPIRHERTAKIATRGGSEYSYTYAELDVIARTVNPILAKHGLSYRWNTKVEGNTLTCDCVVTHEAGHSESSTFALPVENPSAMSPQQKVGAAYTFAQRRSLSAALGLTTTDEDTDASAVDPETITADQVTVISDLVEESGADMAKFLDFLGAASLVAIRKADYARAVNVLKQRQKRGAK